MTDLRPTIFVLFGATGDLARRMVLPAFAALAVNNLMPEKWVLVGNGRKKVDDAWFADHVRDVLGDETQRPSATTSCSRATASPSTTRVTCPPRWPGRGS